jgi:uncharacterized protein (TIGR02466 family)
MSDTQLPAPTERTDASPRNPAGPTPAVAQAVISAFATPLVNYRWPDSAALNQALAELIERAARSHPGIQKSNVGGWHSTLDFINWDVACVRELRGRLSRFSVELTRLFLRPEDEDAVLSFQLDAWANVLHRGEYHSLHNHPNSFWSGVYYVSDNPSIPEHPMSGKLELVDPRPSASSAYAESSTLFGKLLLNPVAGQMLMFPSWLQHCVHPYFGDTPRISIAFNVRFERKGRGSNAPAPPG